MKIYKWILLFVIIISCGTPQPTSVETPHELIYIDQNGDQINEEDFQQQWRNKDNNLVPYEYIDKDAGRVVNVLQPLYSIHTVKYSEFSRKLEQITGKEFFENTIFLLEYTYVDDTCSKNSTNEWSKHVINTRKQFTNRNKKAIEKENPEIVVLNFFETGISLKNSPNSRREYYFQDIDNFLRSTIFLHPSFCGSYAIVKPNGETMVRNGEYNAEFIAQHLKPEIWEQLFPSSE